MGITCEICIYKPENGIFRPGYVIAGIIKYGFDEDTKFSKITVSFKGFGKVHIREEGKDRRGQRIVNNYIFTETYVNLNYAITNNEIGENSNFNKGMYEAQFNFRLPANIPPSLNFETLRAPHSIKCVIEYFIRIKFNRPGSLKSNKTYKQVITVLSGVRPTLPTEPTICGEKKVLTKIFSCKERVINIRATIENCVISTAGTIKFDCEVRNLTDITVKSIHSSLIEMYIFTEPKKLTVVKTHEEKVQDTSSKTGVLKSGKTQHYEFEINVPADKTSIENSKIVLRKYVVLIKVVLPVPHQNVLLKIPVQIGDVIREDGLICEVLEQNLEEPPTYWEVMAESKYDTDDDNDDTSHSTKDMNEIK